MLEILLLWFLTKRIGNIVEEKGHNSGGYKLLTVVFWFGGEIAGALLGATMAAPYESTQCSVYLMGAMGAAAGAGIAYLIASSVTPAASSSWSAITTSAGTLPQSQDLECPYCGAANSRTAAGCWHCGTLLASQASGLDGQPPRSTVPV